MACFRFGEIKKPDTSKSRSNVSNYFDSIIAPLGVKFTMEEKKQKTGMLIVNELNRQFISIIPHPLFLSLFFLFRFINRSV